MNICGDGSIQSGNMQYLTFCGIKFSCTRSLPITPIYRGSTCKMFALDRLLMNTYMAVASVKSLILYLTCTWISLVHAKNKLGPRTDRAL